MRLKLSSASLRLSTLLKKCMHLQPFMVVEQGNYHVIFHSITLKFHDRG